MIDIILPIAGVAHNTCASIERAVVKELVALAARREESRIAERAAEVERSKRTRQLEKSWVRAC